MPIDVQPPSRQFLSTMTTRFALQRDNWNDYSFRTLYHLHYRHGKEPTDVTYIGGVKILKQGQQPDGLDLIRKPFNSLDDSFVSVGTSLDYYQRLNDIPERRRASVVRALNDTVADPELVGRFSNEPGWERSLFRDNREWRAFLFDAGILYSGNFNALPDLEQSFSYHPPGSDNPIDFDFSAPEPDGYLGPYRRVGPKRKRTLLPDRIIVLVGRNGSGKSTLLTRLARVAFASPRERATSPLKALGTLAPPSIGFMRIITISYSAFDSFIVPGVAARDLTQMTQDIEKGDGRFVFCGLRDIAAEVRDDIENAHKNAVEEGDDEILVERRTSTKLKPVDQLADEFADLMRRIRSEDNIDLFNAALEPLFGDASFGELPDQIDSLLASSASARKIFLGWSTGHKIALHVVASLVAHARPRSLVLFDEPEAHLHPPLMAAVIHAVRVVLTHVNAFCVAATHSPVLLQETLARHVRVVRRVGKHLEVKMPPWETFGENVGILTYNTFGLTASNTDFHKVLDLMIAGGATIEEIDSIFTPGLSGQARAYVASRIAAKSAQ